MNSKGEIRRSIVDLNPLIVCTLCDGYFIDPVTLVECLHSFCKTCIMKHVEKSEICPICDTVIHKTKPFSSMREDKTLQDIVFKIVPGLHHNEMLRRKKFYATHPAKGNIPDEVEKELRHKIFFNQDDKFSISIQYFDQSIIKKDAMHVSGKENHSNPGEKNPNKRYLECPGPMQVSHLKKFIAMKYDLNLDSFIIDIIYKDDLIPNNYTLIDIAYNYNWKKDSPMQFFYRIFKKSKVLLKRKRKTSRIEEKSNELSNVQVSESSSPKKCKGEIKSPGSAVNNNSSISALKDHPKNPIPSDGEEFRKNSDKSTPVNASPSTTTSKSSCVLPDSLISKNHSTTSKSASDPKISSITTDSKSDSDSTIKTKEQSPKIIVTSKQTAKDVLNNAVSTHSSVSHSATKSFTTASLKKVSESSSVTKGVGSSSPVYDKLVNPTTTTQTTSIISKEDKNGKTFIIRKTPITSSGVKVSTSSSLTTNSKVNLTPDNSKSLLKKVVKSSESTTTPRSILSKSEKAEECTKNNSSEKSTVVPMDTSDLNGNSEVNKLLNSSGSQSSLLKTLPASGGQGNLSNIVKSLTAKKQMEDTKASSSSVASTMAQVLYPNTKQEPSKDSNNESKTTTDKPNTSKSVDTSDTKDISKNTSIEKKAASAEALAQSIIANYAMAAAAQQAVAANAHQVLTNQISLGRGAYQGAYEHLLRPTYVKVTDPSLKIPIMSSPSVSSPTTGGSQIPNTNRLQFKVQASPSNTNLTSIFSNTNKLPTDIKSLFGASVKKYSSNVPKGLNQSIRQIPNPSLLTNKGNNSIQKK
ncbi:PCGF4 [Lepeophtheirus salmonis]|uniref:PCGF4 n=1 Tax=Lepeophtheirus salmonis TaxID=72036 RepID=A0A7R8HBQ2_LEPSM|nr:PCGF4 [Lepeophtheirus salmonis]CAF2993318.1 PCGF4 [Lepeophtheirus salmonis]